MNNFEFFIGPMVRYMQDAKKEIEADGLVATVDELILRTEKLIDKCQECGLPMAQCTCGINQDNNVK